MIKVGICEDEKITRNFIARMLAQYFKSREIVYQLRGTNLERNISNRGMRQIF